MNKLQKYNTPEMTVVEIMGKDGVMIGIESEGNDGQLSRTANPYTDDNDSAGASRYSHNVWDEE